MRVTHLMTTCAGLPEHMPEAEPVTVEATDDAVRLVRDSGEVIELDRRELAAAIGARAA